MYVSQIYYYGRVPLASSDQGTCNCIFSFLLANLISMILTQTIVLRLKPTTFKVLYDIHCRRPDFAHS